MVRFDKPCRMISGAVAYFREHMQVGEYLSEKGTVPMVWFGAGAAHLGLQGTCLLSDFHSLCRGLDPGTGANLFVRAKSDRRVCFFGQISAPKDVSIALLVGGDRRLTDWWDTAVRETLVEMEAAVATRVRKDGAMTDRPTSNLVAAVVTHDTSRALDPQLHTHIAIMNVTWDATESRWKSLQPDGLFKNQGFFREVCYNRLAAQMVAASYNIEPAPKLGFTIKGFPAELRERFSKRRKEILAEAATTGAVHQDALQGIAGRTRAEKAKSSPEQLVAGWREEAGSHLAAVQQVIAQADGGGRAGGGRVAGERQAVASACAHVYERHSVVLETELLKEALIAGRAKVTVPGLREQISLSVDAGLLLRHESQVISPEALAAEMECIRVAQSGRDQCPALGQSVVEAGLLPRQQAAVQKLLGSHDRIMILSGDAGTGKTRSLRSVVGGIIAGGGKVFGCAPSTGATDALRHELTPSAETLQQLLVNTRLQETTRGHAIIVDEAGLVSIRQMRDLCRLAISHDCRLLLVGDTKQHSSVEAGDALRALRRYAKLPVATLTRIVRQRDPRYRSAVAALARGEAAIAFRRFEKLGAVHEVRPAELHQAASTAYLDAIRSGKSCVVISPVWSEIHEFTSFVRRELRAAGILDAEEHTFEVVDSHQWTREQMTRTFSYRAGDTLTFHRSTGGFEPGQVATVRETGPRGLLVFTPVGTTRWIHPLGLRAFDVGAMRRIQLSIGDRLLLRANLKSERLRNGDIVEVASFPASGGIALRDGRTLPASFRHFAHGYATTSHAAQGRTIDHGILLLGPQGIRAANLKQAYVSNSRFREKQHIFTTDKAAALDAMSQPSDRELALEALPVVPARPPLGRRTGTAAQPSHRIAV